VDKELGAAMSGEVAVLVRQYVAALREDAENAKARGYTEASNAFSSAAAGLSALLGQIEAPQPEPTTVLSLRKKRCTCDQQFRGCRGKDGLGEGWACAEELDRQSTSAAKAQTGEPAQ
jgi:hypothetical protein